MEIDLRMALLQVTALLAQAPGPVCTARIVGRAGLLRLLGRLRRGRIRGPGVLVCALWAAAVRPGAGERCRRFNFRLVLELVDAAEKAGFQSRYPYQRSLFQLVATAPTNQGNQNSGRMQKGTGNDWRSTRSCLR